MSNIVNIFGSSQGALGPVNVTVDPVVETGDAGSPTIIGGTLGATLRFTISKSPLLADQEGSEPFNQIVTGQLCEFELNMVMTTFERLAAVIQGFTSYASGAEGASQAGSIGEADLDIATPIELIKIVDNADSTDDDDQLIICNAAPTGEVEWTYDAGTQRQANIKFRCYKNPKYTDTTTGKELFYFTRSALAAGNITVVS